MSRLRPATAADIPALLDLIHSAYRGESSRAGWTTEADLIDGSRTTPELLAGDVADPATVVLVVEDAAGLLGCCAVTDRGGGTAYFGTFAVRPGSQGSGIGSRLLLAAEERARGAGAQRMEMSVLAQRGDLLAWYARRNYTPTGDRRPFPYGDPRYGRPRRDDLEFVVISAPLGGVDSAAGAASAERIPRLLTRPPWVDRRPAARPVVVKGLAVPTWARVTWRPGEREAWAGAEDIAGPLPTRLETDDGWYTPALLKAVLGRFGDDAVGFVTRAAATGPAPLAQALLPIEAPSLAVPMAEWAARTRSLRNAAHAWLLRHPEAAARGLVPAAVGPPGKERTHAEAALRFLARNGRGAEVTGAARAAGPAAEDAVEMLLAVDPLDVLPARMPALPAWLDPAQLPPVRLAGRSAALPAGAAANLCVMLALCRPGETYAGVPAVRPELDAGDLAQFVWGVFERWRAADYPSRDRWVLEALGLLGDDDVVRRLAPLIRAWPGERASARAVAALDVLTVVGTDVALMHLAGIAEKVPFKGLRTAAAEKVAEIAAALGLTRDQLADRLVPDLGLDGAGGTVLDYGPRQFRVAFDEQLKPVVLDADGSRRKLLPKPAAKDDPALAGQAYARFAGLKKDVKTISADQIRRLERAMVAGRRWTTAEHRRLFVEHPLLTNLARRLVWLTVDAGGAPTGSFRVAEDRTYADSSDAELVVPDDAAVGIAHPVQLAAETLRAWSEIFADYEILQPFPQLGRDTYVLAGDARARADLPRFQGTVVLTGRILGLAHRGWERGSPVDSGIHRETYRHLAGDRYAVVDLDPGIVAGAVMEEPRQTLTRVWLSRGAPAWGRSQGSYTFGELDAVTASELLRDLEMLRG